MASQNELGLAHVHPGSQPPGPYADSDRPPPTNLSVSGVVTYTRCPQKFYWSVIRPLPRDSSRSARMPGFGIGPRPLYRHDQGIGSGPDDDTARPGGDHTVEANR